MLGRGRRREEGRGRRREGGGGGRGIMHAGLKREGGVIRKLSVSSLCPPTVQCKVNGF